MAIRSFADSEAEAFFVSGRMGKRAGWKNVSKVVMRKLDMLHYAAKLGDLRSPPGNHLEALTDDLRGFHSIRVNDQWRVVFKWSEDGPKSVRIIDFH